MRMAVTSALNLSVRGELFQDLEGFRLGTGVKTTVGEVTGTIGLPMGNNAELRAEARADFAGTAVYNYDPMNNKKYQFTLTGAALVWF
jgi:hypothetical protein